MDERNARSTQFPIVGGPDPLGPSHGPRNSLSSPTACFPLWPLARALHSNDSSRTTPEGSFGRTSLCGYFTNSPGSTGRRFLQLGVARAGMLRLAPGSRNVQLEHLYVEGSVDLLEAVTAMDEEVDVVMGLDPRPGIHLASFSAEPINLDEEMHIEFEGALEIGFDVDRLPGTIRTLQGSIDSDLWDVVPAVQRVISELSSFLPAEPPEW